MPNSFALLVLIAWPLIGLIIFRMIKDREQAIIATFVWSFLYLPAGVGFDLPALPPFEKRSIPLLVLVILLIAMPEKNYSIIPKGKLIWSVLIIYISGRFATNITNSDPIYIAHLVLPGSTIRDVISGIIRSLIFLMPIMIGYCFLYKKSSQYKIVYTILFSGLIYSVILLIEVRLSPQFHIWVYGFFPSNFLQQIRGDGFRPVGFLGHGLYAGFFMATCCLAACVLLREQNLPNIVEFLKNRKLNYGILFIYFLIVVILCKSMGSLVWCILFSPCILILSPKLQMKIAIALVIIAYTFPIMRGNDLFPTDTIVAISRSISEKRADSLYTRFINEDKLLERAKQRPLFGWGSWGRNRIYSATTGRDLTLLDGYWVGVIGTAGWVGFLTVFGMLGIPIFLLARRYRGPEAENLSPITSGLCLMLAVNIVELLPNSTLFPWTWLIAGALWGHAVRGVQEKNASKQQVVMTPQRQRTIL